VVAAVVLVPELFVRVLAVLGKDGRAAPKLRFHPGRIAS
jgi:hypothetical protein